MLELLSNITFLLYFFFVWEDIWQFLEDGKSAFSGSGLPMLNVFDVIESAGFKRVIQPTSDIRKRAPSPPMIQDMLW